MNIASQYAKALHTLQTPNAATLKNLRAALEARGHIRLLPQIFNEYTKLALHDKRLEQYKKVTPEKENTRMLLELYKKLIV